MTRTNILSRSAALIGILGAFAAFSAAAGPASGQIKRDERHQSSDGDARRQRAIPWSRAAGKPNIAPGRSVGYFIWHEGDTVYLASTSESDAGRAFAGRIQVSGGGRITGAKGIKDEKADHVRTPRPNVVEFRFDTHEHLDGVKFSLRGGKYLTFALRLDGHKTEHIFLGPRAIEAEDAGARGLVVFDLSK